MIPGLGAIPGAGGGFQGSSSATSTATTGAVGFGGFNFQPKGGNLPPAAWIAISVALGVVGLAFVVLRTRK